MSSSTGRSSIDRQLAESAFSHSHPESDIDPSRRNLAHAQPHSPSSSAFHSNASVASSAAISPTFSAVFTPSSVPMSVQTSQTSISTGPSFSAASQSSAQLDASMASPQQSADVPVGNDGPTTSSSFKRKFTESTEDNDSISAKRAKVGDAMEDVQSTEFPDLGPLYKLCQREHVPSRPHPSQNLLSLYGLDGIASSVARFDPITGEKINRLRQSYEGKIKDLPGRNKKVSKEGELMDLLRYPDEEWHIQKVAGHDVTQDLPDDFDQLLARATNMEPGRLPEPEHEQWKSIIALDEAPSKESNTRAVSQKETGTEVAASGPPAAANDSTRSMRKGTKRRYDDSSFEGYPDTEHLDEAGAPHSPDETGDDGSIRRKKRRDTASSPRYPSFSGQYNSSNTVSVGYGSR